MLDDAESYILGFAMGDGTLKFQEQGKPKSLDILSTDKEHLDCLAKYFGATVGISMDPVRYGRNGKCTWRFMVPVGYMLRILKVGFALKKEDHQFPVDAEILSFLLGFLDADGSVLLRPSQGTRCIHLLDRVLFLGRFTLLEGIFLWLIRNGYNSSFNRLKIRSGQTVYLCEVSLGALNGFRLLKAMYKASPFALGRKRDRFLEVEAWYSRTIQQRTWCSSCGRKRKVDSFGRCRDCFRG